MFLFSMFSNAAEIVENYNRSNIPSLTNKPVVIACDFNRKYEQAGSLKPKLISCPKFKFPKSTRKNFQGSVVRLNILISSDGNVKDSLISSSSGYEDLDEEAKKAFRSCRFKPAMTSDGIAFESWFNVSHRWDLESSTPQKKP